MKIIELTQGQVTLVDDEDFKNLNQFKWWADKIPSGDFYVTRNIKIEKVWKKIKMHRIIMNAQKGQYVDHRDHNTLNNRKSNLRICTTAENGMNRQKGRGAYTSKHKGVSWQKYRKEWAAYIKVTGKTIHLGRFDNENDAAQAYNVAALKYYGEFACLNIIET
ncbi:MAG TPA: AP2 domain-containing protein [Candidatus Glassbacteria bacterium]|nr:AP2 domain-containing protein [Candidatus Glassbacteria bacterium]